MKVDSPVIIEENTSLSCRFNVMPDKFVEETLFIKEYKVFDNVVEATFVRRYHSDMVRSPDHLVFLTALSHAQKMIYIYLCSLFEMPYAPHQPEQFKIWATKVEIDLPKLVTDTEVTQRMEVLSLTQVKDKQYVIEILSTVQDRIAIRAKCTIYLVDNA